MTTTRPHHWPRLIPAAIAIAVLSACATNIPRNSAPARLQTISSMAPEDTYVLVEQISPHLRNGYDMRKINADTRWTRVGEINFGHVFDSADQPLSVWTGRRYDALLVVRDGLFAGVYLPQESVFVSARINPVMQWRRVSE